MTVEELIAELQKIDDKSQDVRLYDGDHDTLFPALQVWSAYDYDSPDEPYIIIG